MAVSKESMMQSYVITFAVLLAVMSNVCQHFYRNRPRSPTFWGCWGQFILMVLSTVLLLVTPGKNLAVNLCMTSFRTHGFDPLIGSVLDWAYMPMFSTRMMQIYTGVAYVFMLWATALQLNLFMRFSAALGFRRCVPKGAGKKDDGACADGV